MSERSRSCIPFRRLGAAAAEVGVLFTGLTIVLGALWGKPVWGTWWTWDPRLTTTAVLLLVYLGYLALRQMADSPGRRARWSAVLGVVGFVDVPIVHMSVVWWRSLHQAPTVLRPGAPTIAGPWFAGHELIAVLPLIAALSAWGLRHFPRAGAALCALTLALTVWTLVAVRVDSDAGVAPPRGALPWTAR